MLASARRSQSTKWLTIMLNGWAAKGITTLAMPPPSVSWPRKWLDGHDDLWCMPFILRGTPPGTAMIRRERRVTGPRFRYIVAGERGSRRVRHLCRLPAGDQAVRARVLA